jgi:hypothetical protein
VAPRIERSTCVPDDELAVDAVEVLPPARVRELVEHDHLVAAAEEALDEMAADEPAAAGDEDPHHSDPRCVRGE